MMEENDRAGELLRSLPRALRLLRESRGLGQDDLDRLTAERGEKVGRPSIVRYERGARAPSLETLCRLLGALEVSWDELGRALTASRRGETGNFADLSEKSKLSATLSRTEGPSMKLVVELGEAEPDGVAEVLRKVLDKPLTAPAHRTERRDGADGRARK